MERISQSRMICQKGRYRSHASRRICMMSLSIFKFSKQIYAWIRCNSVKLGHLYVAATTRPNNIVSVTSILGGTSDNTSSSIARRLVSKTGLSIVVACNIPKDSPMLEATAERKLTERLEV